MKKMKNPKKWKRWKTLKNEKRWKTLKNEKESLKNSKKMKMDWIKRIIQTKQKVKCLFCEN